MRVLLHGTLMGITSIHRPWRELQVIASLCGTEAGNHMNMWQLTILYSRDAPGTPSGCNGPGGMGVEELDRKILAMLPLSEQND